MEGSSVYFIMTELLLLNLKDGYVPLENIKSVSYIYAEPDEHTKILCGICIETKDGEEFRRRYYRFSKYKNDEKVMNKTISILKELIPEKFAE